MNIQAARKMARNCWDLSSKFMELSPTAQKVLGGMGGSTFKTPQNWLGRSVVALVKKMLCWRLDQLILLDDPSVRVMTLLAMSIMHYRSRHIGFIATLYASRENGYTLGKDGKNMSSSSVSTEARRYLLDILNVPNYAKDLQGCANHWEGVLSIDYTKEFSVEEWWDFSAKEFRRREVPPEEVKLKIAKNKKEVAELYRYDLNKLLEKKLSGYYEKRRNDVFQCLDDIFAYLFQNGLSDEMIGAALDMLASIARIERFPEKWLFEFSQKYAK